MRASELIEHAKRAADDKKALDPVVLKISKSSGIASFFLIVHGTSDRHVKTIAQNVVEELEKKKERVWHVEGMREGKWVLLDFGDIVIHVFHHETRNFYNLERLWGDAKLVSLVRGNHEEQTKRTR